MDEVNPVAADAPRSRSIRGQIGGPSAGLMFSLAIYDRLTPDDMTHGREIAGTGEIACDGGVEAIGGIEQKVAGAERQGAEIFLAPADELRGGCGGRRETSRWSRWRTSTTPWSTWRTSSLELASGANRRATQEYRPAGSGKIAHMFDSSLAVPLHFTVEFVGFLVAAGAAFLVLSRPALVPGEPGRRRLVALGFGALAASHVLHGGAFMRRTARRSWP